MSKIDIIITHYNEPWEVGKKLFDSIAMQECVNMEDVHILLVQDGADHALPWGELLGKYPFKVNLVTRKDHGGVASARNIGIRNATSDWLMFIDFDDMLTDICTLSMVTRLFPVSTDVDIIWSRYVREVYDYGRFKDTTFNCEDVMDYRMIGKIYRREFLKEHNVRFIGKCTEYADMIFNAIAFAETYPFKIAQFNAPFYPFYKKFRKDGAFSTIDVLEKKICGQFERNLLIAGEMKKRGKTAEYKSWMCRILADAYNSIRSAEFPPDERKGVTDEVVNFWKENRQFYDLVSENDMEVSLDMSQTEAMSYIQEYYNYFGLEYYLQNDMISFPDFMSFLDAQDTEDATDPGSQDSVEPAKIVPLHASQEGKRAVVYCGTKETYINMIASVKSLLATTHVDKIFFLIEDDVFPYEIPDIIETRNVKDTGLFDPNGPNYSNAWTYMCLMRTAFPQMFPEYDRILSLDIDVVITENVGNLWDIDLTDYYFAGVAEQGRVQNNDTDFYANFGVIMMNLKKLRDDGLAQKLIDAVNTEHFGCPEQDAFNKYCQKHMYRLPNDYNVTVYSHITGEPLKERILHYAGLKYWKHFGPVKKYYNLSWDEIMKLQEAIDG